MTFASSTTGAMQINVIQFGSFGCARTTTKMIRQISGQELSGAGVVSLRSKTFTEEEKYCIATVKRALLEGEKEIHRRLRLK